MRELGFDRSRETKRVGVDGASGWTWCTDSETGLATTIEDIKIKLNKRKYVWTEYGERWMIKRFWRMFLDVIKEGESPYDFS